MRPRDETRALRDAIATSNGAMDVERGRESIVDAEASSSSSSSSSARRVFASALVVVAGACACYASRAGANETPLMMSSDIDARRVAAASLGARLGSMRSSTRAGRRSGRSRDDDDEDSSLGMGGEDDAAPFAAVKGYFRYEKWFTSFSSGKTPGESSRDKKRSGGDNAIQDSPRHGAASAEAWKGIRRRLKSSEKTKLIFMLRHGEALHNVWGETIDKELKTLPCSWHADGDLLDPSLTEVGVDQIIAARASLLGEDGVLSEIGAREGSVPVLASPLSRTMETALIATNGASKLEPPIVVTDYLRERLELNTPFEIRRPVSVDDDTTPASKAIAHTHVPHCKFKKGLNQLYGDELFDIGVKSNEKRHKDCRVDRVGPLSYGHCKSLTLTHESDFDLGDVEEETMLGMMSRVKVVLANIFDTYDENVVVLVTHSDWIIAALMELYPDTLGFVPRNGEIVPVLVEDRRESSQKVSKRAKPTKKHSDDYEDEEEDDEDEESDDDYPTSEKSSGRKSKSKSDDDYPTSEKSSGRKSKSKSDDDYPTSEKSSGRKSKSKSDDDSPKSEKSSGRKSKSKSDDDSPKSEKSSGRKSKSKSKSDDDSPKSKKSSKASKSMKFYVQKQDDGEEKRKSASLGNALSERIITSLKNFHDHLAKYDDDENDKPSETMTWGE